MSVYLPSLDGDISEILASRQASGEKPLWQMSPEEARRSSTSRAAHGDDMSVAQVRDLVLEFSGRSLPARLYATGEPDEAVTVFFHGGGFVTGSLDTHDRQARMLHRITGHAVLSIGYRLAPEHPFPAAYQDGVDSVSWAQQNLTQILHAPGDRGVRVAVAGSSAGANLAAGASNALQGLAQAPIAQLLVYPLLSAHDSLSRREMAEGYGLTKQSLDWYLSHYLRDPHDRDDVRMSPLKAETFDGLPSSVVVGARLDPLYDDAITYSQRLRKANVPVTLLKYPTLNHAFWGMANRSAAAKAAAEEMCRTFATTLRNALKSEAAPLL
ncbi:alpha/beta hydrolase [Pseudarthrobacter sp. YAF2]|uniref:alpha/beta hydrolase n=1 Tax=Pseudarthrobacter sp. YAF2 TaxID=3233078 RepID=UPI003F9E4D26